MKTNLILTGLLILTIVTSCRKTDLPDPQAPETFEEIVATNAFSWETTSTILLEITGIQTPVAISHTLKVSLPDGYVILQRNQLMSQSVTFPVQIPAYITEIVVTYSTLKKTIPVQGGRAVFTYTTDTE